MTVLAYFGINSHAFTLAIDLAILIAGVIYLSMIYWTFSDARRRIGDALLIACATVISIVPLIGPLIYLLLRPPEFLADVRQRDLELQTAQARAQDLDDRLCRFCDYRIEPDFLRCPSCLRKLKEPCVRCGRALEMGWTICPYCETEVPGAIMPRRAELHDQSASGARTSASELTQAIASEHFIHQTEPHERPER